MTKNMSKAIRRRPITVAPILIPITALVGRPLALDVCAGDCVGIAELFGATVVPVPEVGSIVGNKVSV
jgi:hypothetical protein